MKKAIYLYALCMSLLFPLYANSQAPDLGAASTFAVFTAAGSFTNDGATVITGDIGTNVGAFSGFPPGIVIGNIHVANGVSAAAAVDVAEAYSELDMLTCGEVHGTTLGNNEVLTPNIYCLGAASTLNGTLTLDAEGDPDAIFIFQIDGALSTTTLSNILLVNGASLCNVYWQINGAVELGVNSMFLGTILANGAISLLEGASLMGQALSQAGAIDLHNNVVTMGQQPIAPIITADGPTTFCMGDSVILSGNIDGVWSNGSTSTSITVYTGGDYYVVNTNECGSDTSNQITILVNPLPMCNITGDLEICEGSSTTLCLDAVFASYLWSTGEINSCITVDQEGLYAVTITDENGCTSTCTAQVNVNTSLACMITGETILCEGDSTELCATAGASGYLWSTGEISACITVMLEGSYGVTITDLNGCTSECFVTVTFSAEGTLSITCPADITIECDEITLPSNTGTATGVGGCGIPANVTYTDSIVPGACPSESTIIRTWLAIGSNGDTVSCEQTILIEDTTAPSLTCPANITVECASDVPAPNPAGITSTDNCDAAPVVTFVGDVISNQTCANRFVITRTYRATDACGNSSQCSQIITVFDNTLPTITCPANVTVQCASLVPAVNVAAAVSSDNCGGAVTVTAQADVITNQTCANRYTITRVYVATDLCGNTATCAQIITVFDNTIPTISCPADVTVQCASLVPAVNVAAAVSSDNCGGAVTVTAQADVITNQTCADRYTITRVYVATDLCGNTATCMQTITVFDNTAPTITCPANVTVQCASLVPAANVTAVTSSDNCGGTTTVTAQADVITNQTCANRYTITRVYVATDACGNTATCAQTITVFDNTIPTISCPADVTVQCASLVPAANVAAVTSSDNCGGTTTVTAQSDVITNQTCANRYTITRVYVATDACGNTGTCAQIITVFDNTVPTIACPANVTVQCAGLVPAVNVGAVVTSDNCGGAVTVTAQADMITNQTCANRYTITRVYVATDLCGNSATCAQIITVFDNTLPTITCPANITVECVEDVPVANVAGIITSDNCGGVNVVTFVGDVITNQTCPNQYSIVRTYRATDVCGNSATCSQLITVMDNIPPVITFINPLLDGDTVFVQCYGQDPEWSIPEFDESSVSAIDNCAGQVTLTFSQVLVNEGDCIEDGYINLYRLTWTAIDVCGNSANVSIMLELVDTIPPVIQGIPIDITVSCDELPALPIVFAIDECLCACVVLFEESILIPGCQNGQVLTRSWTAVDRCGNQTVETQLITLIDTKGPAIQFTQPELAGITGDSVLDYTCNEGGIPDFFQTLNAASVVSFNTCSDSAAIVFNTRSVTTANCEFFGYAEQNTYVWTATDQCGNETSLTLTVRLIDNEAPTFIGLNEMVCIGDETLNDVDAIDNCGNASVRFWDVNIPNPCGPGLAVRRTYEAFDNCGNMTRDTSILIPNDQILPVAEIINPLMEGMLPGDVLTVNCASSNGRYTNFTAEDVAFSGMCGMEVDVTFTERLISNGDCFDHGTVAIVELIWEATDICGNESQLVLMANIVDETGPVFVNFNPSISIGCHEEMPEYVITDNCGDAITTITDSLVQGNCESEYTIFRTLSAVDPCGNITSRVQTIHVGNGGGPAISGVEEEVCNDLTLPVVTAFDNCAGVFVDVTMHQDTIDMPCKEGLVIERTWSATDLCGNVTEIVQVIILNDQLAPEIMIPSSSVIQLFDDQVMNMVFLSQAGILDRLNALDETSIFVLDDCDQEIVPVFTVDSSYADNCLLDGYYQRKTFSWIVRDACGNMDSVSFTIDIKDDLPPVFTPIPRDTIIICAPLPAIPVLSVLEDLQNVSIVFSESIGEQDAQGMFIVIRTWTATDICGNITVITQRILWQPDTFLECDILLPESVACNSHGVVIGSSFAGGNGPVTYLWEIVGEKCFIQSGQGTPEISIYFGWSEVKIILTITDTFGCVSMCMIFLDCVDNVITFSEVMNLSTQSESGTTLEPVNVHEEKAQITDFHIWPNPAHDIIHVGYTSLVEQQAEIQLINMLGQVVVRENVAMPVGRLDHSINVIKLLSGSYYIQMKTTEGILTKKIQIHRN